MRQEEVRNRGEESQEEENQNELRGKRRDRKQGREINAGVSSEEKVSTKNKMNIRTSTLSQ